jgi:preprotein translocase subunit SecA
MVLTKFLNKIVGDTNAKEIKKISPFVEQINAKEEEYQQSLSEADIPKKTEEFKTRIQNGETVDDLMVEAFALVKYACRKLIGKSWDVRGNPTEWNMIPYDVQLIGGIILHQGRIAEMKTGEGKTLVCTMPIYLNALTGKGVHLVTVNDYLAHRDAEWMGGLYNFLGLTVATIAHGQNPQEKGAAYNADITYGTNNEYGFDYLRDNMATQKENRVQRPLHYAIVDEVDSILIDEARTPLIISAPAEESTDKYMKYSSLIGQLVENTHYNIDEKAKTAVLSEDGIKKMEELMGVENIYTEKGFEEVHHIEQALKALTVFKRDTDYVIQEGQIVIVDEFTGRLMPGRRYSQGLHQAIEAKEKVEIKRESKTLATITFQNYFRLFEKLAGMTGTAATEAEEFGTIYNLDTVIIPTHRPIARDDMADTVYKNTQGKYMAIATKAKEINDKGQPVLIGTVSVEKSEMLSKMLTLQGIKHKVLNAKHHQSEAEIVSNAGKKNAVTIATNMAGRGTDIKLTEEVLELGGLYVIGTERHESRRIDNQLRGRSGRQGDAGASQFYISMEDDIMRLFGSENIQGIMDKLGVPDDMPIENRIISRSIESAQKKVEGRNFDIRKHLVDYDDVMNTHREIMYTRRNEILDHDDMRDPTIALIDKEANDIVMFHADLQRKEKWDYKEMSETLTNLHRDSNHNITEAQLSGYEKSDDLVKVSQDYLRMEYDEKEASIGNPELMRKVERGVSLRVIDTLWMRHIDEMSKLREKVSLRGYGQRDPLIEYKNEAFEMFNELSREIQQQSVSTLFKVRVRQAEQHSHVAPVIGQANLKTNAEAIENTLTQSQLNKIARSPENQPAKPQAPGQFATAHGSVQTKPAPAKPSKKGVTVISADDPTPGLDPELQKLMTGEVPQAEASVGQAGAVQTTQATDSGPRHVEKVGRNEPCPCGSGKKYKKCHGANT